MIDPETAITARAMLETFRESDRHGVLHQQLPALVVMFARAVLVAEGELLVASLAAELEPV